MQAFRFETALPFRGKFPFYRTALRVERIEISVVTSKIDDLAFYHWRADDTRSGREFPLQAMELTRPSAGVCAGVRGVAAEHRLRFCRTRQGEEQKKKRCYFHK